jgi:hypothetical protein
MLGSGGGARVELARLGLREPTPASEPDLADSRWILTVAARALRQAGAESVLPFALALRG